IDTLGSKRPRHQSITSLAPDVVSVFRQYSWPGNVRELRNVIERTLILEDSDVITTEYLPGSLLEPERRDGGPSGNLSSLPVQFALPSEGISLEEAELSFVRQAIERSGGNQTRAAELLRISRDQLRYRLKKLEDSGSVPADSEA
ncbi:MAG: helix-turn-helix domain-containing protein, partial [Pyrinomonadaceae bacterium]